MYIYIIKFFTLVLKFLYNSQIYISQCEMLTFFNINLTGTALVETPVINWTALCNTKNYFINLLHIYKLYTKTSHRYTHLCYVALCQLTLNAGHKNIHTNNTPGCQTSKSTILRLFFYVPPGKYRNSTTNYNKSASFYSAHSLSCR
jgi:hypothetical protein